MAEKFMKYKMQKIYIWRKCAGKASCAFSLFDFCVDELHGACGIAQKSKPLIFDTEKNTYISSIDSNALK